MSIGPARARTSLPRFGTKPALGLFLAFLLLGALYTLPLAWHLGDSLPFAAAPPPGHATLWRAQGDYLQFYYYLWLVKERLLAGASFLRDPYQFAIDGPRSNLPNTFLPLTLLYIPLSAFGSRLAYNALVLLSFPFAGLTAALLAHRYGVGRWAGVVAGAIFACAPYRLGALLGGHPAGFAYGLVPLTLWGLEGALAGSAASGIWAGLALASLAIVEPHFFYFAALGLPLYVTARVGLAGWTPGVLRPGRGAWALATVVALAAATGALQALSRRGWNPPSSARLSVGLVIALGAVAVWQCAAGCLRAAGVVSDGRAAARRSLLGFLPWLGVAAAGIAPNAGVALVALLPLVIHGAWLLSGRRSWATPILPLALVGAGALAGGGYLLSVRALVLNPSVSGAGRTLHEAALFAPAPADLLVRVNAAAGHAIYPGALALTLALAGAVSLGLAPPEPRRRVLLAFGPLLVLGMILSLGPRFRVVPLFEAAFLAVPFWSFVRQSAKFQVVVGLALALLAALGAEALASRLRAGWRRALLAIALALGVAIEYQPWQPIGVSRLPSAGDVYERIRTLGSRALYVPLWPGDSSLSAIYLYTTTLTRVSMLNGYSAYVEREYVTDVYRALEAINLGVVGEGEHAALRRYGVHQVILDRDAFPLKVSPFGSAFTLANLRGSPFLEPAWVPPDGRPLWVFRVREGPRAARPGPLRSPLGVYWEAESLSRETGRIAEDGDASNGRVVLGRAGQDRAGFLVFGPYRMLPAGPFRAVFRLHGEGSGVELQVATANGTRVLSARDRHLEGDVFEDVLVPFTLDAPTPVEYRVKWDGAGRVAVHSVAVSFADVPDPAPVFEVEDLAHGLFERADPLASGGLAGYADPARIPRDAAWSGPFRRYPAGRYRLWVRLKVDRATVDPIASCRAQVASGGPVRGERDFSGTEVPEPGRYVELAVPFALSGSSVLEFPCLDRGAVGIWFDRLRIEGPMKGS